MIDVLNINLFSFAALVNDCLQFKLNFDLLKERFPSYYFL